jgi:hypothetical protein
MNWQLGASKTDINEFGDRYSEIEIEYPVRNGDPAIELRYRHCAGNTGFEYFSLNEYGDLPDTEAKCLLDWLLKDSWTWNSSTREYMSYNNERRNLAYPLDFFSSRAKETNAIAFHKPDSLAVLRTENVQKIEELLSIAANCRMVSVWQPAYGENPVVFSRNMHSVLENITKQCVKINVLLTRVESQSGLPEW